MQIRISIKFNLLLFEKKVKKKGMTLKAFYC
jgi:hypothetical protein